MARTACPANCSGHGTCVGNTCSCNTYYTGSDCSICTLSPPASHRSCSSLVIVTLLTLTRCRSFVRCDTHTHHARTHHCSHDDPSQTSAKSFPSRPSPTTSPHTNGNSTSSRWPRLRPCSTSRFTSARTSNLPCRSPTASSLIRCDFVVASGRLSIEPCLSINLSRILCCDFLDTNPTHRSSAR